MEQQWITIFNIIVGIGLLLYLLRCWQRGFALQLIDLVSWLLAAAIAWLASGWLSTHVPLIHLTPSGITAVDAYISAQVSGIAWFVIVLFALRLIVTILHPFAAAINRLPLIGWLNHLAGLFLGAIKACVIGYLLLVFLHLPLFPGSAALADRSLLRYFEPLGTIALSSGGSMLERLQLVDELQEGDPLEEESLQQLQAWLYGNDGEEEAISDWLESLR